MGSPSSNPPPGHDKIGVTVVAPHGWAIGIAKVLAPALLASGATWFVARPPAAGEATTDPTTVAQRIEVEHTEQRLRERQQLVEFICATRRELRDLEARMVRFAAADAEQRRARKAQSARDAFDSFIASTRDWPCPQLERAQDQSGQLRRQWYRVLHTEPPNE